MIQFELLSDFELRSTTRVWNSNAHLFFVPLSQTSAPAVVRWSPLKWSYLSKISYLILFSGPIHRFTASPHHRFFLQLMNWMSRIVGAGLKHRHEASHIDISCTKFESNLPPLVCYNNSNTSEINTRVLAQCTITYTWIQSCTWVIREPILLPPQPRGPAPPSLQQLNKRGIMPHHNTNPNNSMAQRSTRVGSTGW